MLSRNNDFATPGTTAEDQMKISVVRAESEDVYQKNMYKEAARRVVFENCMGVCELDDVKVPNFNRNFYYNMGVEQQCLQNCYNTRMKLHFGATKAAEEEMLIDFKQMKREFQRYEKWLPMNRNIEQFKQTVEKNTISQISSDLLEKSKRERFGKFDFQ